MFLITSECAHKRLRLQSPANKSDHNRRQRVPSWANNWITTSLSSGVLWPEVQAGRSAKDVVAAFYLYLTICRDKELVTGSIIARVKIKLGPSHRHASSVRCFKCFNAKLEGFHHFVDVVDAGGVKRIDMCSDKNLCAIQDRISKNNLKSLHQSEDRSPLSELKLIQIGLHRPLLGPRSTKENLSQIVLRVYVTNATFDLVGGP